MSTRAWPIALALLVHSGVARAGTIAEPTYELRADLMDGDGEHQLSTEEQKEFFNRARCICGQVAFLRATSIDAQSHVTEEVEVRVGTLCDDVDNPTRDANCLLTDEGFSDIRELSDGVDLDFTVRELAYPI